MQEKCDKDFIESFIVKNVRSTDCRGYCSRAHSISINNTRTRRATQNLSHASSWRVHAILLSYIFLFFRASKSRYAFHVPFFRRGIRTTMNSSTLSLSPSLSLSLSLSLSSSHYAVHVAPVFRRVLKLHTRVANNGSPRACAHASAGEQKEPNERFIIARRHACPTLHSGKIQRWMDALLRAVRWSAALEPSLADCVKARLRVVAATRRLKTSFTAYGRAAWEYQGFVMRVIRSLCKAGWRELILCALIVFPRESCYDGRHAVPVFYVE